MFPFPIQHSADGQSLSMAEETTKGSEGLNLKL